MAKNPKRVAAGRRNRTLRGTLSDTARQLLSEAAHRTRPWEHATGPTSETGKAKSAANGGANQKENSSDNSYPMVDKAKDILSSMSAIRKQLHIDPLTAAASDGNGAADMLREIMLAAGQEEPQSLAAELMGEINL